MLDVGSDTEKVKALGGGIHPPVADAFSSHRCMVPTRGMGNNLILRQESVHFGSVSAHVGLVVGLVSYILCGRPGPPYILLFGATTKCRAHRPMSYSV